tara:strand:+ start:38300 stop:39175 length:876 start_codon:yes stop_codon:yes gene_type:complete
MNIDWLKSFLVFSDTCNFTHAAEKLHISQPALHVKIQKLSDYVGLPLYLKKGREIVLTEEGEQLCAFARELCESTDDFMRKVHRRRENPDQILAAGEGAFQYLLGPGIKAFLKSGQMLKILTLNRDMTIQAVKTGLAHLGVTVTSVAPESLTMQPLTTVAQCLVLPKHHPLCSKQKVVIKDLDNIPLILPPIDKAHRVTIANYFQASNSKLNISVEASGWELMIKFVELGFGLTIVNSCCNIPKGFVAKPLPELPSLKYQLISRKNKKASHLNQQLVNTLLEHKNTWANEE